jgi:hypothetical protein
MLRSVASAADAYIGVADEAEAVRQHARVSEQLVCLHARRAALSLLRTTPPSIDAAAGDAAGSTSALQPNFFAMLELAAAGTPLTDVLRGPAAFIAATPAYALVAKGLRGADHSTLAVLMDKCRELLSESASYGSEFTCERALSTSAAALEVCAEAAHGVVVHFIHAKTHLGRAGAVHLCAYGNEELTMRLARWRGGRTGRSRDLAPRAMAPLIAHGSRVWMSLEAQQKGAAAAALTSACATMVISPVHVDFVCAIAIVEFVLARIEGALTVDAVVHFFGLRRSFLCLLIYSSLCSTLFFALFFSLLSTRSRAHRSRRRRWGGRRRRRGRRCDALQRASSGLHSLQSPPWRTDSTRPSTQCAHTRLEQPPTDTPTHTRTCPGALTYSPSSLAQMANAIIADLFNLLVDYVYASRAAPPVRAMLYRCALSFVCSFVHRRVLIKLPLLRALMLQPDRSRRDSRDRSPPPLLAAREGRPPPCGSEASARE